MALENPEQTALLKPKKKNKYGAKGFRDTDGEWWASRGEFDRYQELQRLERQSIIRNLQRQTKFPLIVNGIKIGTYVADADYYDNLGQHSDRRVVEDAKCRATITATYRLKKKLMLACHGVTVKEVFRAKK